MAEKSKKSYKTKKSKKISLKKEVNDVENWVHEKRRFLKKLGWVVFLIVLLIIASNLYLKIMGVGI
ncbi:MAG: hypothetical protein AABX77_02675 [Nanoarchaeota archaeon]